jgi:hypothetical protein
MIVLPRQARDKHGENSTQRNIVLSRADAGAAAIVTLNVTIPIGLSVRKAPLLRRFYASIQRFTKIGSGQT